MAEHLTHRPVRQFVDAEDYDSSLWTKDRDDGGNLCINIRMKVYFRPVDMKTGPCMGYYQEEDDRFGNYGWDNLLWEAWKREYRSVIEDFWNWKFWLITPNEYKHFDEGPMRPNIRCSVALDMVPNPGGAHQVFNVMKVADYRVNRMFSGGPGFTGWLADVGRGSDPESEARLQIVDEVAHLFSMPHQNRTYANNNRYFRLQTQIMGSGGLTYKGTGADISHTLMGPVHLRQVWHAHPWQAAMEKHTGVKPEKWKVSTRRVAPRRIE